MVAVNTSCLTPLDTPKLLHNTWQHLCLTLGGGNVTLHLDGQTYSRQVAALEGCRGSITTTRNVTVLVGTDDGKLTYAGRVNRVRYYDRELTAAQVKGLQGCEDAALDYLPVTNVSMIGNVSHYEIGGHQALCLPEPKEFVALFHICLHHWHAYELCDSLGGRLINKTEDLKSLVSEINLSLDVTDTTLFLWTSEMVTESTGRVLSINRNARSHNLVTYSCEKVLQITACLMPLGKTVYMKGNNTHELTLYRYNRRLVLLSAMGEMIRKEPCTELGVEGETGRCLAKRSMWMKEEYATLKNDQDIFGRNSWTGEGKAIDNSKKLSITVCEEGKFTCDDGSCIDLLLRCNGVPDCKDSSDEGSVCTFLKPPPPSYWKGACPNPSPVVGLMADVVRVTSVSLDTNEFKVNLKVTTSWQDPRLTFQNLQYNITKVLPSKDFTLMWTPSLEFPEAHYKDNLRLLTKTSILEGYTAQPVGHGKPQVDNSYEGKPVQGHWGLPSPNTIFLMLTENIMIDFSF